MPITATHQHPLTRRNFIRGSGFVGGLILSSGMHSLLPLLFAPTFYSDEDTRTEHRSPHPESEIHSDMLTGQQAYAGLA